MMAAWSPATRTRQPDCGVPAVAPGSYYVLVQVDSLYQVPESNRAEHSGGACAVVIGLPSLTLGTPASGSFTAAEQENITR